MKIFQNFLNWQFWIINYSWFPSRACGRGGKALDMGLSGGSEVRSRSGAIKRFIKSQVRVGLGILTDLNWHLPSNITIMINTPSRKGETCMVYYFYVSVKHFLKQLSFVRPN